MALPIGINYGYTNMPDTHVADLDYLYGLGFRKIRLNYPKYGDSTNIAFFNIVCAYALSIGFTEIIYGICHGTNSNWDTTTDTAYKAVLQSQALFLQGLNSPAIKFAVDNEATNWRNSALLTAAQVRTSMRGYATYTKAYYTAGQVIYSESGNYASPSLAPLWASEGLGDLDMIGWNIYGTTNFLSALLTMITAGFTSNNGFISEFGNDHPSFQVYNNEIDWAAATEQAKKYILANGLGSSVYYFNYQDGVNQYAAMMYDTGSYRYAWPMLIGNRRWFQGNPNSNLSNRNAPVSRGASITRSSNAVRGTI